jgi:hypothetical protein
MARKADKQTIKALVHDVTNLLERVDQGCPATLSAN